MKPELKTNTSGQVSIVWDEVQNATNYELKICNSDFTTVHVNTSVATPEYTLYGLQLGAEEDNDINEIRVVISAYDSNWQLLDSHDEIINFGGIAIDAFAASSLAPCGWNHSHTAAQVGAAAANHTHTAAQVGAAAANHGHTAAQVGAEPARVVATNAEADAGNGTTVRSWTPALVRRVANAAVSAAGGQSAGTANLNINPVRIGTSTGNVASGSIAIGANAAQSGGANGSIAIGQRTTTGSEGIAIGRDARADGVMGNISIGAGARSRGIGSITIGSGGDNATNAVIVGKHARATHANSGLFGPRLDHLTLETRANNQIIFGTPGISTVGFSAWSNISDGRDKREVSTLCYDPVAFIKGLKPKQYKYDLRQCYRHIEEISTEEYNALPEYEKLHRIISMPVFGFKINDDIDENGKIIEGKIIEGFEWITEYAYLGIRPKSEDPTCLEALSEGRDVKSLSLGQVPKFTTLNEFTQMEERPNKPIIRSVFFRDHLEALAAWKLSKCKDPLNLTPKEAAQPLCDPYCYPIEPLKDENGNIILNENNEWVFAQDEEGNCTLTWPFPRKSSDFDPTIVQTRTAYFHFVENEPDGTYSGKRYHNGFIAQEVEDLAKSMGFDFAGIQYFGHHKDENGVPLGDDVYALALEELTAPIVATLQHLLEKVTHLEAIKK